MLVFGEVQLAHGESHTVASHELTVHSLHSMVLRRATLSCSFRLCERNTYNQRRCQRTE
jgi:hypothetical protein